MQPLFRLCDGCRAEGHEHRVGVQTEPVISITVGLMEDGLHEDAALPRWLWDLWTRYVPGADRLEPVPRKFEFGAACLEKLMRAPEAMQVVTQRQHRERKKAEHEAAGARKAAEAVERAALREADR